MFCFGFCRINWFRLGFYYGFSVIILIFLKKSKPCYYRSSSFPSLITLKKSHNLDIFYVCVAKYIDLKRDIETWVSKITTNMVSSQRQYNDKCFIHYTKKRMFNYYL